MRKVLGFCNLHDDPSLGLLTESRPLGTVTFVGRYGLMDFTLSNFSNSGIDRVYVLTKKGALPVRTHIGNGTIWTNNTKLGFLTLLVNEKGINHPKFNTDIANMRENVHFKQLDFEYAVIAPSFMINSMDYRPIVEAHEKSGNEISIVYSHITNHDDTFVNCDKLTIENGTVIGIEKNLGLTAEADISTESFIINKSELMRIVAQSPSISELYSLREIISYLVNHGVLRPNAIKYEGYLSPVLDLEHYIAASFALLDHKNRDQLFKPDWPIYTTTHNTPPALYGANADVENSFIANGAIIKGKVTNSIISRDVVIEEGAEVSNCILFTKSVVGKGVKMEYVVTDKYVEAVNSKNVCGTTDSYLYVKYGAKI